VESDGEAGAALLKELQRWLGDSDDVYRRREVYKDMLLRAIVAAKLPSSPSLDPRLLNVRLKPKCTEEPAAMKLLRLTLLKPLPMGVAEHVLSYTTWYALEKLRQLPLLGGKMTASSIDCGRGRRDLQVLLRKALNYPSLACCRMTFAHAEPVAAEWSSDGRRIWLAAVSVWPLVEVLRHLRESRGGSAELLQINGFGTVFV